MEDGGGGVYRLFPGVRRGWADRVVVGTNYWEKWSEEGVGA